MEEVSVIIPVYNSANYIDALLGKLMLQTYKNLEIILVDDGSADDSRELIQSFQKKDCRIMMYQNNQKGVSSARNFGIQKATGKYIRFLDADDMVETDSIEIMLRAMKSDAAVDLVIGSYMGSGIGHYHGPTTLEGKTDKKKFLHEFAEYPKTFYYGVVWNKLYRKEIIDREQIRFPEEIDWCEDFIFNLQYYSHCRYVYYLPKIIYTYISRENSITQNYDKNEKDRIKEIEAYRCQWAISTLAGIAGEYAEHFEMTCSYIDLKEEVGRLVRSNPKNRFWQGCKNLKAFLSLQQNIKVLCYESERNKDFLVRIIYKGIKYKLYFPLFMLLSLKEFLSTHCVILKKLWVRFVKRHESL